MTEDNFNFQDQLQNEYVEILRKYHKSHDPKLLDESRRLKQILADFLLVSKSCESGRGNAHAIVSLYQDAKLAHEFTNLSLDRDLTADELIMYQANEAVKSVNCDYDSDDAIYAAVRAGDITPSRAAELIALRQSVYGEKLEDRLLSIEDKVNY